MRGDANFGGRPLLAQSGQSTSNILFGDGRKTSFHNI
jgi:prepilin-type processing-associated H-X9-DG protein